MNHPVLLGSTITDDEFKHLCALTNLLNYPIKDISYFWVLSNLSIGCSLIRPHQDFRNHIVVLLGELLAYVEQQKLLRTLE